MQRKSFPRAVARFQRLWAREESPAKAQSETRESCQREATRWQSLKRQRARLAPSKFTASISQSSKEHASKTAALKKVIQRLAVRKAQFLKTTPLRSSPGIWASVRSASATSYRPAPVPPRICHSR